MKVILACWKVPLAGMSYRVCLLQLQPYYDTSTGWYHRRCGHGMEAVCEPEMAKTLPFPCEFGMSLSIRGTQRVALSRGRCISGHGFSLCQGIGRRGWASSPCGLRKAPGAKALGYLLLLRPG